MFIRTQMPKMPLLILNCFVNIANRKDNPWSDPINKIAVKLPSWSENKQTNNKCSNHRFAFINHINLFKMYARQRSAILNKQ